MATRVTDRRDLNAWIWVQRPGRFTEITVVISMAVFAGAIGVPTWLLAFGGAGREHPVDRFLNACQQGVERGPLALLGGIAAGLLIAGSTALIVRLAWCAIPELRRIRRRARVLAECSTEVELCVAGRGVTVQMLRSDALTAFTAGLLRPRIYASEGLVRSFTHEQLQAVLLHEHEHARRRDPLRCWIVGLPAKTTRWARLWQLSDHYTASCEALADAAAVGPAGGEAALLGALRAMDIAGAAPGLSNATDERRRELRELRAYAGMTVASHYPILAVTSVAAGLLILAVAGLSDMHTYWFCPMGTMPHS